MELNTGSLQRKAVSLAMMALVISILALVIDTQPVRATGAVYIRADGSIDPGTAPIQRDANVYALTGNIDGSIWLERDDVTVDGRGYIVQGPGLRWPDGRAAGRGDGVILSSRRNVIIKNTVITGFGRAVLIVSSSNINIFANNITSNDFDGIVLGSSSNNNVFGNILTANGHVGILLDRSSNNSIYANNVFANGYEGVSLYRSSNNSVFRNSVRENGRFGILLGLSSNKNMVFENNLTANKCSGISFGSFSFDCPGTPQFPSSMNFIYHNNFVENGIPVYTHGSMNVWDDSYPSGGNYWSDYAGVDEKIGPIQDQAGSDGLGDTPYVIDANNQDRYPLMRPWAGPVDISPPITRIRLSGVLGDNHWFVSDVIVTLSAIDDTEVDKTEYSFDNANWIIYTAPFTITNEGNNPLYYRSRDKAGNPAIMNLKTIKIDKTAPFGAITINNDSTYTTSSSVTLTLTAADTTSGVAKMRFSNDGTIWTAWETYSTSKTWTLQSGDGAKSVRVEFMDNVGLTSQSYEDTIVLDTTKPIANAGRDQTVNVGTTVDFDGSGSTDNFSILSYGWNFGDGITARNKTTKHTYTAPGTFTVTLTVSDAAGNAATASMTVMAVSLEAFPTRVAGAAAAIMIIGIAVATALLRKRRK